jgi:Ser/Thr protein kinase RdoA (MazF antagonist)
MDASGVLAVLRSDPEPAGEWSAEALGENAYRIQQNGKAFFAKWIACDDPRGQNELEVNRTVLAATSLPVPKLLRILPAGPDRLAVWEWVEGDDLRSAQREFLPEAFRRLGEFHASRRGRGPVSSPVTSQTYETVEAFLEGETRALCMDLSPAQHEACARILQRLSCGYATMIHGDMHPGNLRLASSGPVFLDWGYARWSINLLDLDYIRSFPIRPPETDWWIIQPEEAGDVLAAYFSACGMLDAEIMKTHFAIMVWAALWNLYNSRQSHGDARILAHLRLEYLLEVQP